MPLMEVIQYRDNFTMEAMLININVTRFCPVESSKQASIKKIIGCHSFDRFLPFLI